MKTVILREIKQGIEIYDVNSNEILDKLSEIFEISKEDTLSIKKEYKWFKNKHNHKNIYIFWLTDGITFGVLEKDLETMTETEKNSYLEFVVVRTRRGKMADLLNYGPEGMNKREKAELAIKYV